MDRSLRKLSGPTLTFLMFVGAIGAGMAMHWLITPIMHPHVTTVQYVTEYALIAACISLMIQVSRAARPAGEAPTR